MNDIECKVNTFFRHMQVFVSFCIKSTIFVAKNLEI